MEREKRTPRMKKGKEKKGHQPLHPHQKLASLGRPTFVCVFFVVFLFINYFSIAPKLKPDNFLRLLSLTTLPDTNARSQRGHQTENRGKEQNFGAVRYLPLASA